jgi:RNA polymerase sigma factor (sigma-70 family)
VARAATSLKAAAILSALLALATGCATVPDIDRELLHGQRAPVRMQASDRSSLPGTQVASVLEGLKRRSPETGIFERLADRAERAIDERLDQLLEFRTGDPAMVSIRQIRLGIELDVGGIRFREIELRLDDCLADRLNQSGGGSASHVGGSASQGISARRNPPYVVRVGRVPRSRRSMRRGPGNSTRRGTGNTRRRGSGDFVEDQTAESPFEIASENLRKQNVHRALAALPQREREVIEMRFGLTGGRPRTLEDVGRAFNVTRERIRQIENHTLKKLESLPEAQRLRDAS